MAVIHCGTSIQCISSCYKLLSWLKNIIYYGRIFKTFFSLPVVDSKYWANWCKTINIVGSIQRIKADNKTALLFRFYLNNIVHFLWNYLLNSNEFLVIAAENFLFHYQWNKLCKNSSSSLWKSDLPGHQVSVVLHPDKIFRKKLSKKQLQFII